MEGNIVIFSVIISIIFLIIVYITFFARKKTIESHAYAYEKDFPPKNKRVVNSHIGTFDEKEHNDMHTAWGDMGYYPNKRNEYEYGGSDSSRTADIVKAEAEAERIRVEAEAERIRMEAEAERIRVEAERIRVESEIARMKSKAERLHLESIEAEKMRSKIEQEKYAAEADLKLSVINLSAALNDLRQSSGGEIELARAYAEEMNEENNKLKQKLAEAAAAEAEADKAAAEAARLEAEAAEKLEKAAADKAAADNAAAEKAEAERLRVKAEAEAAEVERLRVEEEARVKAEVEAAEVEAARVKAEAEAEVERLRVEEEARVKAATRVKGWSRNVTSIKNVYNISSPDGCVPEAKKVGSVYWVHRNSKHPQMPNSCDLKAWSAPYSGDNSDNVHISGCTYGGNPRDGCNPNPSVRGYPPNGRDMGVYLKTNDPNECVTKAKAVGASVWGYRTANHSANPNTCFAYKTSGAFSGNTDTSHISGCVDPTRSLTNSCAPLPRQVNRRGRGPPR
tara:strand:- start:416 stop:1942 length:1527 start_codon:yes stop_codon:yes gene_type:complete